MPKLNKEQQLDRDKKMWSLRQQGWTHEMIADELRLERSSITKALGRMSRDASRELTDTLIEEKYAQLAQLRHTVAEAMLAWERSKQANKTVTRKAPGGDSAATTMVRMEDTDGDPRYLQVANQARADLRKLLGLDAPTKVVNLDQLDTATDDQLERIIAGEDPLIVFASPQDAG